MRITSGSPYEARFGFSRAVRVGDRVFVAGTAPIPAPGERLGETPRAQMLRCGEIIAEALAAAGADIGDVVRTRMFITDAAYADEVGDAHREVFGASAPAATMIVSALIDPAWMVEVEAEAVIESVRNH